MSTFQRRVVESFSCDYGLSRVICDWEVSLEIVDFLRDVIYSRLKSPYLNAFCAPTVVFHFDF